MTRILIADDEPMNVEVFCDVFRRDNVEFRSATTGVEALAILESWKPDLIVLDVMMPEMDGIELCKRIKQDPDLGQIPVLMLTARSTKGDVIRGFDAGADDYVAKPFARKILQARVKALLRGKANHDALLRNQEQMTAFVAMVAHDLKSPLSAQIGLVEALQYAPEAPEASELVRRIHSIARFSLDFVNDLLELMRAQTPLTKVEPVDTGLLIQHALDQLTLQAKTAGADIRFDAESMPVITCDPDRIFQVFQNLVENAIKYVEPGRSPIVEIIYEEEPTAAVFKICDNGIGIADKDRKRIFEAFVRLHDHSSYQGTGIGLDIVKRIVEAHLGEVWVTNSDHGGSTFAVRIPLQLEPVHES